jgi:hypothetical protein
VLLSDLSKLFRREEFGEANEEGPEPPMYQRDLSANEPAHQNLVGVGDRPKYRVDVVTLWMCPPAAFDDFASDSVRKARCRPFGRSEDDTVCSDKGQSLFSGGARRHDAQQELSGKSAGFKWGASAGIARRPRPNGR